LKHVEQGLDEEYRKKDYGESLGEDLLAGAQSKCNGEGSYQVGDGGRVSQRLPRDEDKNTTGKKNTTEATKEVQEDGSEPMGFGW
jgi:hypothetical protein